MKKSYDHGSIMWFLVVLACSVLVSYFGQPYITKNEAATNIIVNSFSIMAGFLVAAITFIGDPKSLPSGNWRLARLGSERIYTKLEQQTFLFKAYLLTLVLIFLSTLLKNTCNTCVFVFFTTISCKYILTWIEHLYMLIASIACFYSFKIPSALLKLQKERIEDEITARRQQAGMKD